MFADYHTHTPLCHHACGTPVDYVRAALACGLEEIGFADHNPMPQPFDDWRMDLADLPRYLELVEEARVSFPQIPVRLGLECDFIPGQEPWIEKLAGMASWDYLIGSVHYIAPGWAVDDPKHLSRFTDRPTEEIWALYWKAFEQCVRSRLFDFVAHPDLVKKFGFRPSGDLRCFYEPAIAALAETCTPMEINTAGLRKEVREIYPALEFLTMAREAGVRILINSDAHAPEEVGADFDAAAELAKQAGYSEVLRFEKRVSRSVPL